MKGPVVGIDPTGTINLGELGSKKPGCKHPFPLPAEYIYVYHAPEPGEAVTTPVPAVQVLSKMFCPGCGVVITGIDSLILNPNRDDSQASQAGEGAEAATAEDAAPSQKATRGKNSISGKDAA